MRGYGSGTMYGEKDIKVTERAWSLYLAELIASTSSAASKYWQELQFQPGVIRRQFYNDFVRAFLQLFSDTHIYVCNDDNEKFIEQVRKSFFDMMRNNHTDLLIQKNKKVFELYELYYKYNEMLQQSPLMELIRAAAMFKEQE